MRKYTKRETRKDVQYPCRNCKYFIACGDTSRTNPCDGRDINKDENTRKDDTKHKLFY
jgi:hypothetical protein